MKKIKEFHFELFFLIFVFFGVCMLAGGGAFLYVNIKNYDKLQVVDAEISCIYHSSSSDSHSVYVTYEVDGVLYEDVRLGMYDSSMREGKTIEIYYFIDNPGKVAGTKNGYLIPAFVLIIMGIIFTFLGVLITSGTIKMLKRQKKVKKHGTPIKCAIVGLSVNRNVRVNGRLTYRFIHCSPLDNTNIVYKSNTFEHKNKVIEGDVLITYVDKQNPDNYYVDLKSFTGENVVINPSNISYNREIEMAVRNFNKNFEYDPVKYPSDVEGMTYEERIAFGQPNNPYNNFDDNDLDHNNFNRNGYNPNYSTNKMRVYHEKAEDSYLSENKINDNNSYDYLSEREAEESRKEKLIDFFNDENDNDSYYNNQDSIDETYNESQSNLYSESHNENDLNHFDEIIEKKNTKTCSYCGYKTSTKDTKCPLCSAKFK